MDASGPSGYFSPAEICTTRKKKKKTYCTSKMSDFNLDLMSFTEPVYIQEGNI